MHLNFVSNYFELICNVENKTKITIFWSSLNQVYWVVFESFKPCQVSLKIHQRKLYQLIQLKLNVIWKNCVIYIRFEQCDDVRKKFNYQFVYSKKSPLCLVFTRSRCIEKIAFPPVLLVFNTLSGQKMHWKLFHGKFLFCDVTLRIQCTLCYLVQNSIDFEFWSCIFQSIMEMRCHICLKYAFKLLHLWDAVFFSINKNLWNHIPICTADFAMKSLIKYSWNGAYSQRLRIRNFKHSIITVPFQWLIHFETFIRQLAGPHIFTWTICKWMLVLYDSEWIHMVQKRKPE